MYQGLYRTRALEEYLDLASHSNRDLYLSHSTGKSRATTTGDGARSGAGQMREEIMNIQPANG